MLKEQILQKASCSFARLGIKGVSMDYIATSLRISKKTVYDNFGSKQELLAECVKLYINQSKSQILEEVEKAESTLGAIIAINTTVLHQSLKLCPAFHQDLKHFAKLQEMIGRYYTAFVRNEYLRCFMQGDKEELFIAKHNPQLTLDFLEERICVSGEWTSSSNMKQIENYAITIFTYLAGICTDKGRKELESFCPEVFFNNQSGQQSISVFI